MKITIELTPAQIADAITGQDYPEQARVIDHIHAAIKREAQDEDYYWRWLHHLTQKMGDGKQLIRDMAYCLKAADE